MSLLALSIDHRFKTDLLSHGSNQCDPETVCFRVTTKLFGIYSNKSMLNVSWEELLDKLGSNLYYCNALYQYLVVLILTHALTIWLMHACVNANLNLIKDWVYKSVYVRQLFVFVWKGSPSESMCRWLWSSWK